MKLIETGDNFTLFIFDQYDENNLNKYIKDNLIKIKKRYHKKISGFYNVTVYKNNLLGLIIDFEKEDNFDFFSDIVDLNIKISNNNDIYLEFDNPCLINNKNNVYFINDKYYLSIDKFTKKEFLYFIEFSQIKYGYNLKQLKKNMKLLNT